MEKPAIFVPRRIEKCLNLPTPGIWKARKKTKATRLNQRVSQEPEKGKIILVNSTPSSSKITNVLF